VLTGIALHRNDEFGFGFDAPHGRTRGRRRPGREVSNELAAEFTGA
jgi:hypothetical protein